MYHASGTCLQELVPQTLAKTLTSAWEAKQGGSPMAGLSGISITHVPSRATKGFVLSCSFEKYLN